MINPCYFIIQSTSTSTPQRDGGPNFEGAGLYGFNSGTLELMCDSTSIFTEASPSSSSSNQARSARSDDWYGYRFGCVVDDSPGGKNYVVNKGQGEQRTSGKVVANAAHRRQDGSTGEGGIVPPRSEYSSVLSQQRPAYEPKWALPRLTTMGPAQFGYVWAKAPERCVREVEPLREKDDYVLNLYYACTYF